MRAVQTLTAGFLIAGFLFSAQAQVINLTGTVKDSSTQKGIAGATVKLSQQQVSAVTDTGGAYTLTNQNAVLPGLAENGLLAVPRIRHNNLFFGVTGSGERVRVDLYSISGRHVASLLDRNLDRGNYRINPFAAASAAAHQVYFVKLQNGLRTSLLRMPYVTGTAAFPTGLFFRTGEGDAATGFAKVAAVNDTLIVSAAGHATVRKPITSYTGTNDIILAAGGGHAASIVYDNGSYQGCGMPIVVTVVDSDLTVARIPISVKSTSDRNGITLLLSKVAGAAGTYSDSIFFSIVKSDSGKRAIKVQDQDVVASYYADASPQAIDSFSTAWTGSVGTVDPGMSIYVGLRNRLAINVFDPDVTDSAVFVLVTSDKDKTGINAKLPAIPGSPGAFSGKVGFTFKASQGDSVLSVMATMDDNILIKYHDLTPLQDIMGSICTWKPFPASIFFDSTTYHGTTDKMTINFNDDDITDSTVVVNVKSKKDATGIKDTLRLDAGSARLFTSQVGFTTTTSRPGFIAVQNGDSVTVSYQDDSPVQLVTQSAHWNSN
jgi:hypothetical protein